MKNNNKLLTLCCVMGLFTTALFSAPRTMEEINNVALNLAQDINLDIQYNIDTQSNVGLEDNNEYQVVKLKPKGWVILSKDDLYTPIINYDLNTNFIQTEVLKKWLIEVNNDIKKTKQNNVKNLDALVQWNALSINPAIFSENKLYYNLTSNKKPGKLNAPTYLKTYHSTLHEVEIKFLDNSANEKGFKIYDANTSKVLKIIESNVTSEDHPTKEKVIFSKLTGLKSNTKYEIYVVAFNDKGESEKLKTTFKTKKETKPSKPNAPIYLQAYYSTLHEVEIQFLDNSTNEKGFKIYDANTSKVLKVIENNSTHSIVSSKLTGLKSNTKYEIYVVAFNDKGESEKSKTEFQTKKEEKPGQLNTPTFLMTYTNTLHGVEIKFLDTSMQEKGFKIYDAKTNKVLKTIKSNPGTDTGVYTKLTELKSNTVYEIYVVAYDDVGESTKSKTVKFKTLFKEKPGKLNAPTFFNVFCWASNVVVVFQDNSNRELGFKMYDVKTGKVLIKMEQNKDKNSWVQEKISGLKKNTKYEVYLVAFDNKGESEKIKTIFYTN